MSYFKKSEVDGIFHLSLNRPEVRNAFNPEMIQELTQIFQMLSNKSSIRAIVLRGEGKVFCAGGDLNWMKDMVKYNFEENNKDAEALFGMFEAMSKCTKPIIGVAHGAAFGGALGMLAVCDYVIAEEKTQFCFSEVKLGIAPAVISAFVLKKCTLGKVGPYMLSGHIFTVNEALNMGLIHDIGDEESFDDKIESAMAWFNETAPTAVQETKALIHRLGGLNWAQTIEETTNLIAELRVGPEGQEGLNSFLEKRKPNWRKD